MPKPVRKMQKRTRPRKRQALLLRPRAPANQAFRRKSALSSECTRLEATEGVPPPCPAPLRERIRPDVASPSPRERAFELARLVGDTTCTLHRNERLLGRIVLVNRRD